MKILQVISGNDFGGGLQHVLNICRSNEDLDSSIYFIGEGEGKKYAEGIPFKSASVKQILSGDLSKYIIKEKFDLINFHGAKANFIYGILHNKIKIPSAVTIHSDFNKDFLNNKIKQILYLPLVKYGLTKYENYICASGYIKKILTENKYTGEFYTTFNGIDISDKKTGENDLREKLNIPDKAFIFICVARFHPVKNHKNLIESFKKIEDEFRGAYLILVGDGPLEKEMKDYSKDLRNVRFLGFKKNTWDYFGISDANILVSFSEGGEPPIVILEGGLKKLPVIVSEISGMEEILKGCGYFINPDSIEEIYDKMKLLYSNREDCKVFGNNLYNLVINNYSLKAFGDKYYSIYKSIIDKKRR